MRNRIIKSKARSNVVQLADCLSSIFSLELLIPSPELYLISPWIGDMPVLNNLHGQYRVIAPEMINRWISLAEFLSMLSDRGTKVRIICRPNQPQNDAFLHKLPSTAECRRTESLHEKGLITHSFYLRGSMNFTYSGVHLNDESVELTSDPETIAQAIVGVRQMWEDLAQP